MSSNIQIQKICHQCGKEFTAKTTVTLFCSLRCNSRAYKAKQRADKIGESNKATQRIKSQPFEDIKAKEFLTVRDVSTLLSSSLRTVYRLIELGKIDAVNISIRKTLVKRSDLDRLFKEQIQSKADEKTEVQRQLSNNHVRVAKFDISDCYNLTEVQDKYGISETALQNLIKRNSIAKIKKGRFAYVPKMIIDNLLYHGHKG